MSKYKYGIKINKKVFAKNMTLQQCMKLSVKLGKKGINHTEYGYEEKSVSKYIIKNCPCRMELHENDCFGHTGYNNCCACTDCVMKQIVELCRKAPILDADWILNKLDIQEVE